MKIIGLDIGGTKMEAIVYQFTETQSNQSDSVVLIERQYYRFEELAKLRRPTNRDQGYQAILSNMAQMLKSLIDKQLQIDPQTLKGVGVALPGAVHPEQKKLLNGNTQAFVNHCVADDLKALLGWQIPFFSTNDANCFALAELYAGAGIRYFQDYNIPPDRQVAVGVILGTGVGTGLIHRSQIIDGAMGAGGEGGHIVLKPQGRECFCSRLGCAETYLSGTGIAKSYFERTGQRVDGAQFFERLEKGDTHANEIIQEFHYLLRQFLLDINNLINPHYFVLGGGVSRQKIIYQHLEQSIRLEAFLKNDPPKVYQHQLSDAAGSLGAAMLAF